MRPCPVLRHPGACWLLLAALALTSAVGAQAELNFPALTGRVVDEAGLLDARIEQAIATALTDHEAKTSNQIVVATVESLNGYDIAEYANRLARHWALGTAENDNGALLLVAPHERLVRIEVGYGLEGALTDALASTIIRREILPAFRRDDYQGGIRAGVGAMIAAVAGEYTADAVAGDGERRSGERSGISQGLIPLLFIVMVGLMETLRRSGRRRAANAAFPAGLGGIIGTLVSGQVLIGFAIGVGLFLLMFMSSHTVRGSRRRMSRGAGPYIGGGFGGGGGGFGGGGFGGGGGGFGGGGASGGW